MYSRVSLVMTSSYLYVATTIHIIHNTWFINSEGFQPLKQHWAPESCCCSFSISQLPIFVPSHSSLTLILRKEKEAFWK